MSESALTPLHQQVLEILDHCNNNQLLQFKKTSYNCYGRESYYRRLNGENLPANMKKYLNHYRKKTYSEIVHKPAGLGKVEKVVKTRPAGFWMVTDHKTSPLPELPVVALVCLIPRREKGGRLPFATWPFWVPVDLVPDGDQRQIQPQHTK